jgi:cardiolipin synthase
VTTWLLSHHIVSLVVAALTLVLAGFIVNQPRPTGSALAWLLIILFAPYLGIPLYLVFGGRKFRRRRSSKSPLTLPTEKEPGPFGLRRLGHATSFTRTDWCTDGVSAYQQFLSEVRRASSSIRIVTFVVGDDETGVTLLDALAERAKAGVEVRLLLDGLLVGRAPRAPLARLRACGGKIAHFMPLLHLPFRGQANLRNHRKIAIFDGERAIVGGMNLADEYMGPLPSEHRWRDLSLLLAGDVVSVLDGIFRADWEFASREVLGSAVHGVGPAQRDAIPVRVVPSGPDAASDPLYDTLLTGVFRAERRFWIATPYFIPDAPLLKALVLAVRRGVDVRIIVPAASNHLLADLCAAPGLRQLRAEGATVRPLAQMLHAKAMLMDDALAVVGSANFDMRSLFLDYEVAVFFSDPKQVARLAHWFEQTTDLAVTNHADPSWLRSSVEGIVRLLAPLL